MAESYESEGRNYNVAQSKEYLVASGPVENIKGLNAAHEEQKQAKQRECCPIVKKADLKLDFDRLPHKAKHPHKEKNEADTV